MRYLNVGQNIAVLAKEIVVQTPSAVTLCSRSTLLSYRQTWNKQPKKSKVYAMNITKVQFCRTIVAELIPLHRSTLIVRRTARFQLYKEKESHYQIFTKGPWANKWTRNFIKPSSHSWLTYESGTPVKRERERETASLLRTSLFPSSCRYWRRRAGAEAAVRCPLRQESGDK